MRGRGRKSKPAAVADGDCDGDADDDAEAASEGDRDGGGESDADAEAVADTVADAVGVFDCDGVADVDEEIPPKQLSGIESALSNVEMHDAFRNGLSSNITLYKNGLAAGVSSPVGRMYMLLLWRSTMPAYRK